jgi:hypothetical protein
MPVLDTERTTMPRSALRYRPIAADDQARPARAVSRLRHSHPEARTTIEPAAPDNLDLEEEEIPVPPRRSIAPALRRGISHPARSRRRLHPLFFCGVGLLIVILLWLGISQLISWGTNEVNDLRYGTPRTFQTDEFVGQGDSAQHPSHFIALNLHGTIVVVEFLGGDPAKTRDFELSSALGPDADLEVVTLRFVDVNHNGRPDMLVDIGGVQSILVNDGSTFRPPTPVEQQQILQYLQ